ncbi:hypothetical protein F5B20DRAFT_586187 [Whalleya microplaca]|nr:hypothetical protein F5B20DRAFT_586187 [Whalleya microplaca]
MGGCNILQQFVTELAEARARGRKPENYGFSMNSNWPYGTVVDPLDDWIDFLTEYYPDEAPSAEALHYSTDVDAADAEAQEMEAEDEMEDDSDEDTFSFANEESIGGMINDFAQEAQHQDKKMRFTTDKMEDLEIEDIDYDKLANDALARLAQETAERRRSLDQRQPEQGDIPNAAPENKDNSITNPTIQNRPQVSEVEDEVNEVQHEKSIDDQNKAKNEKTTDKPAPPPRRFKPKAPRKRIFERMG